MKISRTYIFFSFLYVCLLLTSIIQNYKLRERIVELEARKPIIIYHADNYGAASVGKITKKEIIDGHYTVTVDVYGKFLVTKEQYEDIKVGDEIPDYLKQRGI